MRVFSAAVVLFILGMAYTSSLATEKTKQLQYKFDPPAFSADGLGTVFFHFLPVEDQFAANINCMAQPYTDTLETYDKLTQAQFKQMAVEIVSAEIGENVLTYEYHGKQQGRHLHWYAKAFKRGDLVYLVTATGLHDKWGEHAKALVPAVDSFDLIN